jgi:hypothetical protein
VAHATIHALDSLLSVEEVARMRGKDPAQIQPFWKRGKKNA